MVLAAQAVEEIVFGEMKIVPTEISLRDVCVSYATGGSTRKTVISNLSLDIEAGEFVVVLGETGCGKSTLLRLVLGQEFPTTGTLVVDGKRVNRIDARCGYVPQKYGLFPDRTMIENVMYGPENAYCGWLGRLLPSFWGFRKKLRRDAESILIRMGLRAADMKKYPHQLSGGMQQRVTIAQALIMSPPVLLMDEAFSALDPATRGSLQQQLKEVWQESKPTVLFVTHNTAEALLLGTRLIIMRPHNDARPEGNVLLDMKLPQSSDSIATRLQSKEFQELKEFVELQAFGATKESEDIQSMQGIYERGESL